MSTRMKFIRENRLQIYSDIISMLEAAPERNRSCKSRFEKFDRKVLSAVCRSDAEFEAADDAITKESCMANEDAEKAGEFLTFFEQNICAIPDYDVDQPVVIPQTAVDNLLASSASKLLDLNGSKVSGLIKAGLLPKFSKDFRALPERERFPRSKAFFYGMADGARGSNVEFQYIDHIGGSLAVKFRAEMKSPLR